jgi:DNA-directed RNA polymerase specialized sigma24 family protein
VRASPDQDLDELAAVAVAAQQGDRAALAALSRELQQPVYRLALRFCGHPIDAEDVTLEVMLRLLTTLETYDERSRFTMWAYANAVRQMLRTEPRPAEVAAQEEDAGPSGILLCLSREERLAYVLSDLLGFAVAEGADVCAIDEETFQGNLIVARSIVRRRRAGSRVPAGSSGSVGSGGALSDGGGSDDVSSDDAGSDAPDTVWERLVATMPSHLGSN